MIVSRRRALIAAQWIFAAAVVWAAARALHGQWSSAAGRLATLSLGWSWIVGATALVLLTYVLLIETWRRVLAAWQENLPLGIASRIWFISNLGKYIPGKIWSIAAMSVMAREHAVSPMAAAGSSIMIQLVSVATGIALVLVTGIRAIDQPVAAIAIGVGLVAGIAAMPLALPRVARAVGSFTGRPVAVPALPAKIVWISAAGSLMSWIAYGIAFQLFTRGVLGSAAGATSSYIAVYAASYIIGFLALFVPGGVVVRESALVTGMVRLGLAGQADAFAVAVASRLWLTVVELLPGFIYLALARRSSEQSPG